jgi:hypothetical protein
MIFDLGQVMVMETPVDLFDQFRGSLEIDLSGMDIHVTHIGCQPWKPGIDVLSVPIPGQQPINCKRMPEVMDAWTGVPGVTDTALSQQAPKSLVDGAMVQAPGSLIEEERRVGRAWGHFQSPVHILL